MSRHQFSTPDHVITVGWDSPLNTFFATVFLAEENDEDEPLIWLGQKVGEFNDAREFLEVFRRRMNENNVRDVVFSDSLAQRLEEEQRFEGEGFGERPTEITQFILGQETTE